MIFEKMCKSFFTKSLWNSKDIAITCTEDDSDVIVDIMLGFSEEDSKKSTQFMCESLLDIMPIFPHMSYEGYTLKFSKSWIASMAISIICNKFPLFASNNEHLLYFYYCPGGTCSGDSFYYNVGKDKLLQQTKSFVNNLVSIYPETRMGIIGANHSCCRISSDESKTCSRIWVTRTCERQSGVDGLKYTLDHILYSDEKNINNNIIIPIEFLLQFLFFVKEIDSNKTAMESHPAITLTDVQIISIVTDYIDSQRICNIDCYRNLLALILLYDMGYYSRGALAELSTFFFDASSLSKKVSLKQELSLNDIMAARILYDFGFFN